MSTVADNGESHRVNRHNRTVMVAGLAGASVLVVFRLMIEFGFGPKGSLRVKGIPLRVLLLAMVLGATRLRLGRKTA